MIPPGSNFAQRPSFGSYELLGELARGGMGVIFLAQRPGSEVRYALKTLLPAGVQDAEELLRFRREAEILGGLDHAHIVRIHAADLDARPPWLVQDLLPGGTLEERLRTGPLPIADAVQITAKIADAVEHAHLCGVLHRDLKPLNVLFDDRGEPRVVDFGLAQGAGHEKLTRTGSVLGTPAYMAPEQAMGLTNLDERTDVYAIGGILYALLTGHTPVTGSSFTEVVQAVLHQAPATPSLYRPRVPSELAAICLRALEKAPESRFQRAADMAAALRVFFRESGAAGATSARLASQPRRRRAGRGAAAVGAIVVALTLGVFGVARLLPPVPAGVAPTPTVDRERPQLVRLDPAPGAVRVERATLRLVGVVVESGAWVELTAGDVTARVEPGAFQLEVPVPGGFSRVTLRAQDAAGEPGDRPGVGRRARRRPRLVRRPAGAGASSLAVAGGDRRRGRAGRVREPRRRVGAGVDPPGELPHGQRDGGVRGAAGARGHDHGRLLPREVRGELGAVRALRGGDRRPPPRR